MIRRLFPRSPFPGEIERGRGRRERGPQSGGLPVPDVTIRLPVGTRPRRGDAGPVSRGPSSQIPTCRRTRCRSDAPLERGLQGARGSRGPDQAVGDPGELPTAPSLRRLLGVLTETLGWDSEDGRRPRLLDPVPAPPLL